MKRSVLIALVLLLAGWSFSDFRASLRTYELQEPGGQPELFWISEVEEGVNHYEVRRKLSSEFDFRQIGPDIAAKGAKQVYSYIDTDLYKASGELIEYRLFAISDEGVEYAFAVREYNYTPTAVRRTWGSIKAMFQ